MLIKEHWRLSKNRGHANIINNYIEHTSTARARERESLDFHSTCEESHDVSRKLELTLCALMAL